MKQVFRISTVLVLALFYAGCQGYAEVVDIEAETQVLRDLGHQWAEAESNKNLEGALSLYWEDAVMLVPDQNPIKGVDALRPAFEQFFQLPFTSLESGPVEITVTDSGKMAYSWANYFMTFPGPEGPMNVSNKFIAVWEKRNGEWKIAANMSNTNPIE